MPSDKKIMEAKKMLSKFGLQGAPVVDKSKIIGMITLGDIRKALKYRYGHASIKGYMSRSIIKIKPDTPLHVIQKTMFDKNIGRLPVLKGRKLVGIVTRTDVLKSVHRDIFKRHKTSTGRKRNAFNISVKMKKLLPKQILKLLHQIGQCANSQGYRAFVVGGFVRDMLLGVRNYDIDIVVEGDAMAFGKRIADICKASPVVYKKFGTSTVVMDWPKGLHRPPGAGPKFKIDFATARKESYEAPAALPTVEFSLLKDDLKRRDFTINAMAASINKGSFGQLIDFFGGEKDLENANIKVLHDASFIDDPTRIFRAVRFEQRFGFRIDKYTQDLIKHAIREGMFSKTQHHRIRDELVLMLQEKDPLKAIMRMKDLHELRFVHKEIRIQKNARKLFTGIKNSFKWYDNSTFKKRHVDLWLVYLMALLEKLNFKDTKAVCGKFAFRRSDRIRLLSCKKSYRKVIKLISSTKRTPPSRLYSALEKLSFEEILFIRAKVKGKLPLSRITDFFVRYNGIKTKIGGEDLKKLGMKPSPLYTKILTEVLHKKVDGELKTKKDELEYVKKIMAKL